jgi:hypothetical protein
MLAFALTSATALASEVAGFWVEPMITYEKNDTKTDFPAPFSNSTGTTEGAGLGARLGFQFADIFFVGIDGRYAKPRYKDSSNNLDADSTKYNYGPMVGVQTPLLGIKVWGQYILDGVLDPEASNNTNFKYEKAYGTRVGLGVHFVAVSINLEYQDIKYNSATIEQAGPFTSTNAQDNINLHEQGYVVSIGFPIGL